MDRGEKARSDALKIDLVFKENPTENWRFLFALGLIDSRETTLTRRKQAFSRSISSRSSPRDWRVGVVFRQQFWIDSFRRKRF